MLDWNQSINEHDGSQNTAIEAPQTCDNDDFFILHDA